MSRYAFTFKKDDMFVEFVTSDRDVVERQFQIWVSDADDYVNGRLKKNFNIAPQIKEEIKIVPAPEPVVEETMSEPVQVEPQSEIQQEEHIEVVQEVLQETQSYMQPEISMPSVEKIVEEAVEETPVYAETTVPEPTISQEEVVDFVQFEINKEEAVEEVSTLPEETQESPEVFDKASTLLKTINTIQNPQQEEEKSVADFGSVLDQSLENPIFEPNKIKDQVFLNLLNSKKTEDKFNFLIITAYYLSEFEKMERFSLKQINAKLMQNVSAVIEHPTLQEAINQNLLESVPDLTGVSEVAEYRLTRAGEEFFANII